MSNSIIRRLFFNELKNGLKKPDGTLEWIINQDGVINVDDSLNEIKYNETNLRVHLIPAPAETETLQGDHVRYMGIYQIDARILLDIETDLYGDANLELDKIVDKLQSIFKINLLLTDTNGFSVQVLSPLKTRDARREGKTNWWHAICYFDYRADTNI